MSGSYTQIFGGGVTNSVYPSYQLFALTALNSPLQLVWPSEFVTSNNFTSNIIEFSATVGGLAFKMPPANLVSVGMATLFTNLSAFNVTLFANDGTTTITTFPPSSSTYVYLINNSTTNGQFRVVPWGGGFPAVVSIAAVSTSPDLLITGSPVTSSGTFTFSFSGDINNIINVSGTGILTKTAPNTWSTRTITGTPNQITVVNGSGVAGNPTISLPAAVSGIISLTASNVRLGFSGTNTIDTADGNPLIVNDDLSITPTGGIANDLRFYAGNGLKFVAFKGPTAAVADVTWTLPNADATVAGMVLSSNAAGVLSWITPASGTVNSVTGTAGQIVAAPTTGAVVLSLANTAVAPGAYTTANITVDAFGRITAASNGSPTENDATLINTIAQPGHALVVGDWVYFNGVNYVKAKADALLTAEVLGMVTNVVNPNSFVLTMYGYVPGTAGLAGLIAGDVYWLSDATAGLMTNTKPTTVGNIEKPIFVADSATSGYVINYRGKVIPAVPTDTDVWVMISDQNIVNAASINIIGLGNPQYLSYRFELKAILPLTPGSNLLMQTSTDNGATYTGAADYSYVVEETPASTGTTAVSNATGATSILLSNDLKSGNYSLISQSPTNTGGFNFSIFGKGATAKDVGATQNLISLMGYNTVSVNINAVKFFMSAGNITGRVVAYGLLPIGL